MQNAEVHELPGWPGAVSPTTGLGALADWALHLVMAPAKQAELLALAGRLGAQWWLTQMGMTGQAPLPPDSRFADADWSRQPWLAGALGFLLWQQWWQAATTSVPGVSHHHEQMVEFAARQWLDPFAPSNSLVNPQVLRRTAEQGGANLLRGLGHAAEDLRRELFGLPPPGAEQFRPGHEVALTPGRVVARNQLMELIQYAPSTLQVRPEPVLVVPAWIMKYYVLDLQPANSLIKYLVDAGFSVFAISWKNPGADEHDLGLEDYERLGIAAALASIAKARPGAPVHGVGYCLGGTLLAMSAALHGRSGQSPFKTLSLLAAQTDFSEPGELSLFVDESQLAWLDSQMAKRGYLGKRQMAATFQMLRSRDLVWSYRLRSYLLGERPAMSALMAWNADGTRLPARMHSDYLRSLYLENSLAKGDYRLGAVPISLADIRIPLFMVGMSQDHVAPWRSVYKLHQHSPAPKTFVLSAGGHNVGIVNPPGNPRSSYQILGWQPGQHLLLADEWLAAADRREGSWWPAWTDWLAQQSSPAGKRARALPSLGAAPGRYVLET